MKTDSMTLACPAYLHRLVPVQDLQDWKLVEAVKAPEKTNEPAQV